MSKCGWSRSNARKAMTRMGWAVIRSPAVPPSVRVMVSTTRWDGIRVANAWVTVTTSGNATAGPGSGCGSGSGWGWGWGWGSVMNRPGGGVVGVRPPQAGESAGQRVGVQLGGRAGETAAGGEQVPAGRLERPGRRMRGFAGAAELDPSRIPDAGAAHPHRRPRLGGGDPDVG